MSDIWAGLQAAFWLIVSLDSDLVEITLRSLQVSLTALVIASAIACATEAAVLTGPIAPLRMKGTTMIPCPRPQ